MKSYHAITHHAGMRVRVALEHADALRKRELDYTVKVLGKCRVCGRHITDKCLEKHPGLCSDKGCRRRAMGR